MNKDKLLDKFSILMAVFVISGIFGFIYETIFYRIDLGYFVKRGTTFGPWIPIYAIGGGLISIVCNKIRNKTLSVFTVSMILCGFIEFITGYVLFKFGNIRLWDYNVEIWNFGNIGGYICVRSVVFFGMSGVFLMKIMLPLIEKIKILLNKEKFYIITFFFGVLFAIDIMYSSFNFLFNRI